LLPRDFDPIYIVLLHQEHRPVLPLKSCLPRFAVFLFCPSTTSRIFFAGTLLRVPFLPNFLFSDAKLFVLTQVGMTRFRNRWCFFPCPHVFFHGYWCCRRPRDSFYWRSDFWVCLSTPPPPPQHALRHANSRRELFSPLRGVRPVLGFCPSWYIVGFFLLLSRLLEPSGKVQCFEPPRPPAYFFPPFLF